MNNEKKLTDININNMIELKVSDEKALAIAERRLKNAPTEHIIFRNTRGKTRCYKCIPLSSQNDSTSGTTFRIDSSTINTDGKSAATTSAKHYKEQYLSISLKEEIRPLVDKRYCKNVCIALRDEIYTLGWFIKRFDPQKKYDAFLDIPKEFQEFITPIIISPAERCRRWKAEPFESNTFPISTETDYINSRGERFRSRGEYLIADIIFRMGLAYHYEEKLQLRIAGKTANLFPDFTIMHPKTCELYYLEFFGMMDNPEYAKRALEKIQKYQEAGLGTYLITIFDCSSVPLKSKVVESVLKQYLEV